MEFLKAKAVYDTVLSEDETPKILRRRRVGPEGFRDIFLLKLQLRTSVAYERLQPVFICDVIFDALEIS